MTEGLRVQRNKRTGEVRHSLDGGATWQPGRPSQDPVSTKGAMAAGMSGMAEAPTLEEGLAATALPVGVLGGPIVGAAVSNPVIASGLVGAVSGGLTGGVKGAIGGALTGGITSKLPIERIARALGILKSVAPAGKAAVGKLPSSPPAGASSSATSFEGVPDLTRARIPTPTAPAQQAPVAPTGGGVDRAVKTATQAAVDKSPEGKAKAALELQKLLKRLVDEGQEEAVLARKKFMEELGHGDQVKSVIE